MLIKVQKKEKREKCHMESLIHCSRLQCTKNVTNIDFCVVCYTDSIYCYFILIFFVSVNSGSTMEFG